MKKVQKYLPSEAFKKYLLQQEEPWFRESLEDQKLEEMDHPLSSRANLHSFDS